LINAQNAGAVGAVVFDDAPNEYVTMQLTSATLPAMFVTQADGMTLQLLAAESAGATTTLDFTRLTPFPVSTSVMANYSSAGPTPAGNIKPDLVAVGGADPTGAGQVITAESTNKAADPYQIASGTSISAPFVSGSIAVLMAARAGFTGQQYKSMVVNSAGSMKICDDNSIPASGQCGDGSFPVTAQAQVAGAGRLDLLSAYYTEMTSAPTALSFGTGSASSGGSVNLTLPLNLTNISLVSDTFTVQIVPIDGSIAPTVDMASFTLGQAAIQTINLTLSGSGLPPGSICDGFIVISGGTDAAQTTVPYWYGVPGTSAQSVAVLNRQALNAAVAPGATVSILVRSVDPIGLPIAAGPPIVSAPGTKAVIGSITAVGDIPGTYQINATVDTGGITGLDTFLVRIGGASVQVVVPVS
jgi:hypothetical protein